MLSVPVTFLYDFDFKDDKLCDAVMGEASAHGCLNLVLTDTMISEVMRLPSYAGKLRSHAAEWGLRFVDSHAPFGSHEDLDVVDESERGLMLDRLRVAMRIAHGFGVKTMTVHVGNGSHGLPGYTATEYHESIIRSLEALLPLAEELDMILCIENIWFATNTPDRLLDILTRLESPHLGVCYDSGHANLMRCDRGVESSARRAFADIGPVPYDDHILEKLLPHVVTCHLHDNNGVTDEHTLPGRGDIDWPHIMGLLGQAPRLACVQSEVIPGRVKVPLTLVFKTFQKLMSM